MTVPPAPQGTPGLFRFAQKGMIPDLFEKAGLKNIEETEVAGKLTPGNRKNYWNFMTEIDI
jgi:hypothetical protein